jgi:hypothetical protein
MGADAEAGTDLAATDLGAADITRYVATGVAAITASTASRDT